MGLISLIFLAILGIASPAAFAMASCSSDMERLLAGPQPPTQVSVNESLLRILDFIGARNAWPHTVFEKIKTSNERFDLSSFALENLTIQEARLLKQTLADLWIKKRTLWEWQILREKAGELAGKKSGGAQQREGAKKQTRKIFYPKILQHMGELAKGEEIRWFRTRSGNGFLVTAEDSVRVAHIMNLQSGATYDMKKDLVMDLKFYENFQGRALFHEPRRSLVGDLETGRELWRNSDSSEPGGDFSGWAVYRQQLHQPPGEEPLLYNFFRQTKGQTARVIKVGPGSKGGQPHFEIPAPSKLLSVSDGRLLTFHRLPDNKTQVIDIAKAGAPVFTYNHDFPHTSLFEGNGGKVFAVNFSSIWGVWGYNIDTGERKIILEPPVDIRTQVSLDFIDTPTGPIFVVKWRTPGFTNYRFHFWDGTPSHTYSIGPTYDQTQLLRLRNGETLMLSVSPIRPTTRVRVFNLNTKTETVVDLKSLGIGQFFYAYETDEGNIEGFFAKDRQIKKVQLYGPGGER